MAELGDSMDTQLEVETATDPAGQPVIRVAGDLDIANVERLRSAVDAAMAKHPERLTFHVSALRFMDSAGIAVLLGAASHVPSVRLHSPSPIAPPPSRLPR